MKQKPRDLRMESAVASADISDVVIDATGCAWRRYIVPSDRPFGDYRWAYLTDDDRWCVWDWREQLPKEYEPYLPVDDSTAEAILKGVGA